MHLYVLPSSTCYGNIGELFGIPTIVIDGIMGPPQMAENKQVTRVVTPIDGVITFLKAGKGPPCSKYEWSIYRLSTKG